MAMNTLHYTVYFWKIPCVDVTVTVTSEENGELEELLFTARSRSLFSIFFSVDNTYRTVFNPETFHMVRYEKTAKQPNEEQEVILVWDPKDQTYQYEQTKYRRPAQTHNIFSFLMHGRPVNEQSDDTQWWNLDHEGRLFRSRYVWLDSVEIAIGGNPYRVQHYRLDMVPAGPDTVQLVQITDIFTWGIGREDCVRQIWVESGGKRRILRAQVNVGGFSLVAELKG